MGANKKTRRRLPFLLIEKRLIESPVWVQAGKVGRDIYIELKHNYNGFNNRELICAYTYMRNRYGYGYNTLSQGFKRLEEIGLIKLVGRGELAGLSGKKANMYELVGEHEKIIQGKT